MIFISGVHGVGKSYFCNIAKDKLGISAYSASQLISKEKNELFAANKLIADIEDNQVHLLSAIAKLRATGKEFILDGLYCRALRSGLQRYVAAHQRADEAGAGGTYRTWWASGPALDDG